jgi:hypothetical protein
MATPPQAMKSGGDDQGKRQALISVNDLTYVLPPDLSVAVVRTHTNHYFQQSEYTNNQRSICILNTGAHYIDTRCSSLEFGIRLTGNNSNVTGGYFGDHGTALNLIESITISSRAGDELCRINDADLLHYITTPMKYDQEWLSSVGQGMGYRGVVNGDGKDWNRRYFSIPLYALSDLFAYGRLMPSMLMSGLRISISWTRPDQAFQARQAGAPAALGANRISSYTIINPYISTYAYQLSDGVQRDLNELSATNGLEIVYCDWEPTSIQYATAQNLTVQLEVRKAASRALTAIAWTRDTRNIDDGRYNSYQSKIWDYRKYQWQLGSLYFPQQPVIASTEGNAISNVHNNVAESYKHALIAFGTYKDDRKSGIYFIDREDDGQLQYHVNDGDNATNVWRGFYRSDTGTLIATQTHLDVPGTGWIADESGQAGTYSNSHSVLGVNLERTDLFNMSGVPINNARVLSLRVQYQGFDVPRTLHIFLKYVRLARCFLNNVEVEQ